MKKLLLALFQCFLGLLLLGSGCGADGRESQGSATVWKGEQSAQPPDPVKGWAYYDTARARAYYWDGSAWLVLGSDGQVGDAGSDGVGILWQGSLAAAPANPQPNWAYYDTDDYASYIYSGGSWRLLAQDSRSFNAAATVAHGSYLELNHGLGLGSITYDAFCEEDGLLRPIGLINDSLRVSCLGGQSHALLASGYSDVRRPIINSEGHTCLAYRDPGTGYAMFGIWDGDGQRLLAPKAVTSRDSYNLCLCQLDNGNYALCFSTEATAGELHFVVFGPRGSAIVGDTTMSTSFYYFSDILALEGGFVIARVRDAGPYRIASFVIYGNDGSERRESAASPIDADGYVGASMFQMRLIPGRAGGFGLAYIQSSYGAGTALAFLRLYDSDGGLTEDFSDDLEDCEDAWNNSSPAGVSYGVDGFNALSGSSAAINLDESFSGGLLASEALSGSVALADYSAISLYVYSDIAWGSDEISILLDGNASLASPEFQASIGSISPGTWHRYILPLSLNRDSLGAVAYLGLSAGADRGAASLRLDSLKLLRGSNSTVINDAPYYDDIDALSLGGDRYLLGYRNLDGAGRCTVFDAARATSAHYAYCPDALDWQRFALLSDGSILACYANATTGHSSLSLLSIEADGGRLTILTRDQAFHFANSGAIYMAQGLASREAMAVYGDSASGEARSIRLGRYSLELQELDEDRARLWNFSGEDRNLRLSLNY